MVMAVLAMLMMAEIVMAVMLVGMVAMIVMAITVVLMAAMVLMDNRGVDGGLGSNGNHSAGGVYHDGDSHGGCGDDDDEDESDTTFHLFEAVSPSWLHVKISALFCCCYCRFKYYIKSHFKPIISELIRWGWLFMVLKSSSEYSNVWPGWRTTVVFIACDYKQLLISSSYQCSERMV